MLGFLKDFFGVSAQSEKTAVKQLIADAGSLLVEDFRSEQARQANDARVDEVMERLQTEVLRLREEGQAYAIAATAWAEGMACANLAMQLSQHFRAQGWLAREVQASGLWVTATLAVASHYHHLVGPAMLAYCQSLEDSGQRSAALDRYEAVFQDFVPLLDHFLEHPTVLDEDDRVSIGCLQTAVARLMADGRVAHGGRKLEQVATEATELLERAASPTKA